MDNSGVNNRDQMGGKDSGRERKTRRKFTITREWRNKGADEEQLAREGEMKASEFGEGK